MEHGRLLRLVEVQRSIMSELDLQLVIERLVDGARSLTGASTATVTMIDDAADGPLSALRVPICVHGERWGTLHLTGGPCDDGDVEIAGVLAECAAAAIANVQRVASVTVERAMKAAEEERRRWARELHDETLQEIAALRVLLGAARKTSDPVHVFDAVDHAVERLGDQADLLRSLITDLHPAALDRLGVGPAIDALVERLHRRSDAVIAVDVRLGDELGLGTRLERDVELVVYRVVQEALTNVVRHAGARHASLSVVDEGDVIRIRIADDGDGFDPVATGPGFGLVGMRERVARVRGTLDVLTEPGEGTVVTAAVPALRAVTPLRRFARRRITA